METNTMLLFLLFGGATALQCDVPGECVGQLLGFASFNSSAACLKTCKGKSFLTTSHRRLPLDSIYFLEIPQCTFYTFINDDDICNILETCSQINEDSCPSCVSGNSEFKSCVSNVLKLTPNYLDIKYIPQTVDD